MYLKVGKTVTRIGIISVITEMYVIKSHPESPKDSENVYINTAHISPDMF